MALWVMLVVSFVALLIGAGIGAAGEQAEDGGDVELAADLADAEGSAAELSEEIEELQSENEALEARLDEATSTTEATTTTTTEPPTTTTTTAAPPPAEPVEVARFTGASADTQTGDFTVDGDWEMHWNISGGAGLIIRVTNSATGSTAGSPAPDPGTGESLFRNQSGTYYLDVSTFGTDYWEIWIVDLPD